MDLAVIFSGLISLFTLAVLEIVLGVDNLIFIAMASNRLAVSPTKISAAHWVIIGLRHTSGITGIDRVGNGITETLV